MKKIEIVEDVIHEQLVFIQDIDPADRTEEQLRWVKEVLKVHAAYQEPPKQEDFTAMTDEELNKSLEEAIVARKS